MSARILSLDELLTILRDDLLAETHLPVVNGEVDLTSLPTFGGSEPESTAGVWSWDERRLLVGDGRDDLRIVPRYEPSDLVLCESADGWSFHAPESTDEQIATGEATYILTGPGEAADEDRERAFRLWLAGEREL